MAVGEYLFALYMSSIDAIVMTLLKAYKIGMVKGFWVFPFSFIMYGFQAIVFYWGLSLSSMTILNILWNIISNIVVSLIGIYFFGETLNTIQWIGIVLSLTGMTLLGIHNGDADTTKKDE